MTRHRWSYEAPYATPCPTVRRADLGWNRTPPTGKYRKATHGRYLVAGAAASLEQRIVNQAGRLSPGQAVTGWAALRWWGAGLFDGLEADGRTQTPVPLAVGPGGGARQNLGATILYDRLPDGDVVTTGELAFTTVPRATFDAIRLSGDVESAVSVIDSVIGAGLMDLEDFAAWIGGRAGWKGIRLARQALPLAQFGVRSPFETKLRLAAHACGIKILLVNHIVSGPGTSDPGEVDLLDPEAGMVMEFDGADHRTAQQHRRDLEKEDGARRLGLVLARFTSSDLHRPTVVRDRIMSTRAEAQFAPPEARQWIAEPPAARRNRVFHRRLAGIIRPS